MNKVVPQALLIVSLLLVSNIDTFAEDDEVSNETKQQEAVISDELKRLNIETVGESKQYEVILPEDLMAGAMWGVRTPTCKAGGYDIEKYAGLKVDITTFSIVEPNFDSKFLSVHVVTRAEAIVCVYKSNDALMSGIYRATKNFADPLVSPSDF